MSPVRICIHLRPINCLFSITYLRSVTSVVNTDVCVCCYRDLQKGVEQTKAALT